MTAPGYQQRLAALRDVIADIERKPALAEARQQVIANEDGFPILPGGLLQEVFTDDYRNAGASLGFALAQAKALLSGRRIAVIYLQLATETKSLGLPYGPGLLSAGFDPSTLVLVRPANMLELLWAAEEAIACRAVAAVVADISTRHKLLDFTASRRLSLRAAEGGGSMFFLRYGHGREASAAQLRWHLLPAASGQKPYDNRAPGQARWQIRLERGSISKQHAEWVLEWTENGLSSVTLRRRRDGEPFVHAPLPRPFSSQLANGLSQTA